MLHRPNSEGANRTGVVFCHGWSGGRLGPHRMFVKAARKLAAMGIYCLRPDFRGRGASEGDVAACGIQTMAVDTVNCMDYLANDINVSNILLLGICSGAKVAISVAVQERDVSGLVLWSAEALGSLRKSETGRRKATASLAIYARKLLKPATWRKIVTGRVDTKSVKRAVMSTETRSHEEARREDRVLGRFRHFRRPVLFIYGGNDPDTALAGKSYETFCDNNSIPAETHVIPNANHSFYSLEWEAKVLDLTCTWIRDRFPQPWPQQPANSGPWSVKSLSKPETKNE